MAQPLYCLAVLGCLSPAEGLRARVNAGFDLWQLVYASKAALTSATYAASPRRNDGLS